MAPQASESKSETISTAFKQQVELTPNKLALVEENRVLTYRDLQIQSVELSHQLNLDNNPIIAILLPGGVDHIISIFAVLNSSRAFSLLSVDYPALKLQSMLESIGNPLLITKTSVVKEIGLAYENVHLLDSYNTIQKFEVTSVTPTPLSEDNAAIYFTSGSTGVPKACLVGNRALVRNAKSVAERLNINENDEYVFILNPAFVLSMRDILMLLLSGATIHVPPNNLRYDTSKLRKWVKSKENITIMSMVCSVGEAFFNAEPEEFPHSLRLLLLGGEKLQTRPPTTTPFQVFSSYGSTEMLSISSTLLQPVSPLKDPVTDTLVGQTFPDVEIYVLDEETLKPLETGEIGEIYVGGPNISTGYLNSPIETNQKFINLESGVKVFRTGDLGYLISGGNLVVINRRDNQVKVSGYRFDLSDLESALLQHSSVEKAVAVLEKSDEFRFHLFYSLKPMVSMDTVFQMGLNDFLKDRLPYYAFPHSLTCVDKFPRNVNGKLDRKALLEMRVQDKMVESLTTITEMKLARIWSEILEIPYSQISRGDNFFSLGGSSLTASKVINKLQEIKFTIEIFHIFKIPVLKNLSQYLADGSDFTTEDSIDFEAEVNLFQLDLTNVKELNSYNFQKYSKSIFLTGATGYLGSSLLLEILSHTEADVFCLIRASSTNEAQFRLEERFKMSKLKLNDKYWTRIHFVLGTLSKPNFGLGDLEYNSLSGSIDQIYHCAAEVHWLKRYEELRTTNVLGTVEILKLASTKRLKFLHYISTVSVLEQGSSPEQTQLENRQVSKNIEQGFGYAQSKWVAEKLVWKAVDAGMPAIVYRPGIIGSHSESNIVNTHDFITIFFEACRIMNAFPDFRWKFPYGTLNFTTKAIVTLSQNLESHCSKAFHIFQNILSFESFYDYFDSEGLRKVSLSNWRDMIFKVESGSKDFESLGMIKLFLTVPFHQNLTIFEIPYSEHRMNITNSETLKLLNSFEPRPKLLNEMQQIKNFGDSIFS